MNYFKKTELEKNIVRGYPLKNGDIFSVTMERFFSSSILWSKPYQIIGTYKKRFKKKILWFWVPKIKETTMIKIIFTGDKDDNLSI